MKILPLILSSICLISCASSGGEATSASSASSTAVSSDVSTDQTSSSSTYKLYYGTSTPKQAKFDVSYFDVPASTYSKDIALLSFALSMATYSKADLSALYGDLKFENAYYSPVFESGPKELDSGYAFASRKMNGYYLINVSIKGWFYGEEWADNVYLGPTGNQAGYDTVAKKIKAAFDHYLEQYASYKVKYLITGYSKAAAIAQLLGADYSKEENQRLKKDDIYVYTFESPSAFGEEVTYSNIHHLYNSDDYVPKMAPSFYGLYHGGVPRNIYSSDIAEYVHNEFPEIAFDNFAGNEKYPTLSTLLDDAVSWLGASYEGDTKAVSISTRQEFVDHAQEPLRNILRVLMSGDVPFEEMDFSSLSDLDVISIAGSEHAFINALYKIMDVFCVTYDQAQVEKDGKAIFPVWSTAIRKHLTQILGIKGLIQDNVSYISKIHLPAVTYSLLINS